MIPETEPDHSPQHLLQRWIDDLPFPLLLLEKVILPQDFRLDYSPGSLDALEAHLLARDDSDQDFVKREELMDAVTAYVGEVLLSVAGGAWGWNTRPVDDRPGQPVVSPDPELELSPVAPLLLIAYALRVRTGTAFADEVERLRQAVTVRQEADPGWTPVKAHTPRVDPVPPLAEDPALTAWLAERPDSSWGRSEWGFFPETLDRLEAAVRERFATVEEFDAARDDPFVQGACWYLGEVIRRNKGAVWQYIPFDPEAEPGTPGSRESLWTEVPYVDQPYKRVGGSAIPLGCLRELFLQEDRLRDVLVWFRATSYAEVGALLRRMDMVSREKADAVLEDFAEFAHQGLNPHEVPSMLEEFGVAVSAHGEDVDFLEESYAHFLQRAAALTEGAVTITGVRLREEDEYDDVLEFARNGVPVTQQTEHLSDDYLDILAIVEVIGHVDPDPGEDTRRFHLVDFQRRSNVTYDTYFAFATPEQAAVLERELGLELR
ncbi:hypothetical protein [Streptomyces sp. NBC_01465]|uniref:hypothetical protein n=1 Tax=Streptomyces sp. NBC_01465 TaxID=2903878 RepID=UPI002E376D27|nr:hypothetical protein [Streptomyces sp. NBC_01465]